MRSHTGIILALLFITTVLSQDFTADFQISNKPGLSGILTGKIYYSYASKLIRWQYKSSNYQETTSYNTADVTTFFSFRLCGSKCDTIPNVANLYQPRLFKSSSTQDTPGATATILGQTCTRNTRTVVNDEKITRICVNDKNQAVEVVYQDGTTIRFQNIVDSASATELNAYKTWGCVFSCDSNLDIALVLDESGSISGVYDPNKNPAYTGEWASVATFAQKFTQQFNIGPNKINMGLVKYGNSVTKTTSQLTDNSVEFNKLVNGLSRCTASNCNSYTRIGNGAIIGVDLLRDETGIRQTRKNVPKILVLVTDGYDNNPNTNNIITIGTQNFGTLQLRNSESLTVTDGWGYWAKVTKNIKIISVGVGSETDPAYLKRAASSDSLYFAASTFDYLKTSEFISKLGTTICSSTGTQSGCNVCGGLCACGVCQCPDVCDDGNACTSESCSPTVNGGGCLYKDIANQCNDGKRCTHDSCNPATGCVATPYNIDVDCNDNDKCTVKSCDNTTGCQVAPVNCTNPNPCLVGAKCIPSTGLCTPDIDNLCESKNPCNEPAGGVCNTPPCTFVPIDCTGGNKCISTLCNKSYVGSNPNGCFLTKISCDDGNNCTEDTCDPIKGCIHTPKVCNDNDLCTDDRCDDKVGCIFERFNVTERCNKGDLCTNYTCEASVGCREAPLKCPNSFNDTCLWVVCDPLQGCAPSPKKCNYTGKESANCYVSYCDSSKDDSSNCYYEQTDECRLTIVASTTAAVLGIGAIIGIIIAAVVCVGTGTTLAVLGFNGAFSGEFENKNPLYEKETKEGQNPLYKRNSKLPKPN